VLKNPGLTGLVLGVKWQFSSAAVCVAALFSSFTVNLQSIFTTSVEAERPFSTAGILCTKIRSRLSDATAATLDFVLPMQLLSHALATYRTDRCSRNLRKKLALNRMLHALFLV